MGITVRGSHRRSCHNGSLIERPMNRMLRKIHQLTSSVCIGLCWTNGAVLLWDGYANEQYQGITVAVALLFGVIGGIVFGAERSLSRICQCFDETSGKSSGSESSGAWTLLYVCLISGSLLILVAMGIGLIAIIRRLQEGFHIFG